MFFKALRTRRSSKAAACQSISDTPPLRAPSHCTSSPNAPTETTRATDTTRATRPDREVHDYELFLERARTEEEKRQKAQQQQFKEAERKRAELSMDPWTRRM